MAYRIEIKRPMRKALLALPQVDRSRIAEAIEALADDPRRPGARKLTGSEPLYRRRVGDYRVI